MDTKERLMEFISSRKMSVAEFERICGLSNGYVGHIKNTVGRRALSDIHRVFPELNKAWLLCGEGDMLNPSPAISQQQNGGTGNTQSVTLGQSDMGRLIEELVAQRRMTEKAQEQLDKSQEQINRLLSLLEKTNI